MTRTATVPPDHILRASIDEAEREGRNEKIGLMLDAVRNARETVECWGSDFTDEHNELLVSQIMVDLHNALTMTERLR